MRILKIIFPLLLLGAGAFGVYRYMGRHLDKQASRLPPPSDKPGLSPQEAEAQRKIQKERLAETLRTAEETRKINAQNRPTAPQNPTEGVQQTLKTLEEINRINKMNQELRQKQK